MILKVKTIKEYSACLVTEICMSYQWTSSSILSLYYLCSGSYDLSSLGYYGLFVPRHQVWPFQFLHKHKRQGFSLCFAFLIKKFHWSFLKMFTVLYHIFLPVFTSNHMTDHFWQVCSLMTQPTYVLGACLRLITRNFVQIVQT